MQESEPDFLAILDVLVKHEVEFIIVGGVCAVLLGAPVATFDLDIVHSRDQQNIVRLAKALKELKAVYREHLPKQLAPNANNLKSTGHHLLTTSFGPLDVLGQIGIDDDYEQLETHIETIKLETGARLNILNLDTLIRVKEKTVRDKDRVMLRILRAMKEELVCRN